MLVSKKDPLRNFLKQQVYREVNSIAYITKKDVDIISRGIRETFNTLNKDNASSNVINLRNYCIKNRASENTVSSLTRLEDVLNSLIVNVFEDIKESKHTKYFESMTASIHKAAKFNSVLDDDGKRQLIINAKPVITDNDYSTKDGEGNSSVKIAELRALEFKIKFNNLQNVRNSKLAIDEDQRVLKKLIDLDVEILDVFPSVLQESKLAVMIAIAQLQSGNKANRKCALDLSKMPDSLKKDREIFASAGRHANTDYLLKFAHEEVKKDEEFFCQIAVRNGNAIEYADESVKESQKLAILAVQQDLGAAAHLNEDQLADICVMVKMITAHGQKVISNPANQSAVKRELAIQSSE